MTAQERADKLWARIGRDYPAAAELTKGHESYIRANIREAIRAAERAERERCARVAEESSRPCGRGVDCYCIDCLDSAHGQSIAATIRQPDAATQNSTEVTR